MHILLKLFIVLCKIFHTFSWTLYSLIAKLCTIWDSLYNLSINWDPIPKLLKTNTLNIENIGDSQFSLEKREAYLWEIPFTKKGNYTINTKFAHLLTLPKGSLNLTKKIPPKLVHIIWN